MKGPGQADKHRAEMEPRGPWPPVAGHRSVPVSRGARGLGQGGAGWGEPPGIPLGLVLVPAGSASLCGPGASGDKTACGQRTCSPSDPSTGQGL